MVSQSPPSHELLHVVMVVSNPCAYERRWTLARQFAARMRSTPGIALYAVEVAYEGQDFHVTDPEDTHHLQVRTGAAPVWIKESMINLGVRHLVHKLCPSWQAMAWIDADVEFENEHWVRDTMRLLVPPSPSCSADTATDETDAAAVVAADEECGEYTGDTGDTDIVQLFAQCRDMDREGRTMQLFTGFACSLVRAGRRPSAYGSNGINMWHPGYAYAITRDGYEKAGGIFDLSILGSGDFQISQGLIGRADSVNQHTHENYRARVRELTERVRHLRVGFVPGVIRHHFHGTKQNRRYNDRWKILVKHQYDPDAHMERDHMGLIQPSPECPPEMLRDIMDYFRMRQEDD